MDLKSLGLEQEQAEENTVSFEIYATKEYGAIEGSKFCMVPSLLTSCKVRMWGTLPSALPSFYQLGFSDSFQHT